MTGTKGGDGGRRRTRKSARDQGTRFETSIAQFLALILNDKRIERRAKTGSKDRGDIAGVHINGERLVIECKNYGGRLCLPEWIAEAQQEAENDRALAGVVVVKRRGTAVPGAQWVCMTLADFVRLVEYAQLGWGTSLQGRIGRR